MCAMKLNLGVNVGGNVKHYVMNVSDICDDKDINIVHIIWVHLERQCESHIVFV